MSWMPDLSTLDTQAWRSSGDEGFANGGLLWRPFHANWAEAVEVTPVPSEMRDGEEKAWFVRWNATVFLRPAEREDVLATCGYTPHEEGILDGTGHLATGEEALMLLVEAAWAHGGLDDDGVLETVTESDLRDAGLALEAFVRGGRTMAQLREDAAASPSP